MIRKIALITGGSRGLGRSSAIKLAEKDVAVILTYLNRSVDAEAVVQEIANRGGNAVALQLDSSDLTQFELFEERLKTVLKSEFGSDSIDYLVNNAGFGVSKALAETTVEDFDALMNVHFRGVFFLTQRLLHLIKDSGRILNVSTGLTRFSYPGYAAYAAMKGAVETYTRYLAQELGARNISVNVIAPGAIETDFGGGIIRDNAELNAMVASSTSMGRAGLPDDIGNAVSSFLVDNPQWITGQRIEVSGGMHL